MITLTKEQSEAVHQNGSSWTQVVDPQTQETFVLVRADVFAKLSHGLTDDVVRDFEPLIAELCPEDWEDSSNYPCRL